MKRFTKSSIFRRFVRGFTLVEVILGSMIMAGFVGGTVFIAGQIGEARIGSLGQGDRNAWANVQTQLAAEGIDATFTNAQIWNGKGFDNIDGGLAVASNSNNLPNVLYGEGLVVRPFRIDLTAIDERSNRNTVGFILMDRTTAGGASVMDKPSFDPDNVAVEFQILVYDKNTDTYSLADPSNFDAWNDINWADPNSPKIYLLAHGRNNPLDAVHISTNGLPATLGSATLGTLGALPAAAHPTLPTDWTGPIIGGAIDPTTLFTGNQLNVSYIGTSGAVTGLTKSFQINVTKIDPVLDMHIVNENGSERGSTSVTLADVLPSVMTVSHDQRVQMNTGRLVVDFYGDEAMTEPFPAVLNGFISITNTVGSFPTAPAYVAGTASAGFTIPIQPDAYGSEVTRTWTVQVTSISPFVNSVTRASSLTPIPTYLPDIMSSPFAIPSFAFSDPYILVTLAPVVPIDLPGITEGSLYDIRYTIDGSVASQTSQQYNVPIELGRSLTYLTSATVRAKAFNRLSSLGDVFLKDRNNPLLALYTKQPENGTGDFWNYGSYGPEGDARTDNPTYQKWNVASSWLGNEVPNGKKDGKDRNVFFASVRPDNGQVQVNGSYTIGGLFFTNWDRIFTLTKPNSGASTINFLRDLEDNTELTVVDGSGHVVNAGLFINQPIVVNAIAAASLININEVTKNAASSHGVYKQGDGTLVLNSTSAISNPSDNTARLAHQIRYVVEKGSLQLGADNSVSRLPDDALQAGVVLDGGMFDMNGFDQNFDQGTLTVTNPASLRFGGGSVLSADNVNINTRSSLRVFDYHYPVTTDRFYAKYPGLATLRRITYPQLNAYFGVEANVVIYGRWIGTSTTTMGEIIPRRPPTATGFAYLTVTKSSRIFFDGANKLSVQDIDVYEGNILEIRKWGPGDVLTVELDDPRDPDNIFTVNECLDRIMFYDDAGNLLNYRMSHGTRIATPVVLRPITVFRDRDNKEWHICTVTPN
ncbi:MAG: chitobiase/beta-hexosaminidase C-terminal domain-containing protein [Opitutales bacterium]|jgi:hypothetical protein